MGYRGAYEYVPVRANIIKDTLDFTATIVRVQALENTEVASITSDMLTVDGKTPVDKTFPMERGTSIDDILISKIRLNSGAVIVYAID